MTDERRAKRAVRTRMAETGEKYTEARRALLGGADSGAGRTPPSERPPRLQTARREPSWRFTDQAYNQVLLAEDEARMLGRAVLEPEHLLLALARRGNVEALLSREGLRASAIFGALLARDGLGQELVSGRVPHSRASEEVITGAMRAAALRGVHGPSTEHVLLALAERSAIAQLLRELGIDDATALVDAAHPRSREPLQLGAIELDARMALAGSPPSPGPIPPLFERFSVQAQGAVASGIWFARELESGCVEPAHLLIGLLRSNDGVIAGVQQAHEPEFQAAAARAAGLLSVAAPASGTGIFTPAARTLVAEDALAVAHRLGDPRACLSSAHLLLAAMGSDDAKVLEALSLLGDRAALAAELAAALPGEERMSL